MNNEEKILAILEKQGAMLEKLCETQAQQAKQLQIINERLDAADTHFAHIEERLDELDTRSLRSAVLLETEVARDIRLVYEGQQLLQEKLDTLAPVERVEALEDDVAVLKDVVHQACADIAELKKAQ